MLKLLQQNLKLGANIFQLLASNLDIRLKDLTVWYKTKFFSQNLATKFGVFLVIYVMF